MLDTAVKLVPKGFGWYVRENCSADGDVIYANAQVWRYSDPRDDEAPRFWANAPEKCAPIALCIAALKAVAASRGEQDRVSGK